MRDLDGKVAVITGGASGIGLGMARRFARAGMRIALVDIEAGPLELEADEPLELRVFVDKSVVEVFANGRQAVMRRVYPTREDSVGVTLFSNGGPTRVTTFEAWDVSPSRGIRPSGRTERKTDSHIRPMHASRPPGRATPDSRCRSRWRWRLPSSLRCTPLDSCLWVPSG